MAAYPTDLPVSPESKRLAYGGIQIDTAESGRVRSRTLYSEITYEMQIEHPMLTADQRDSILTHYASDVGSEFSYTWPDGAIEHSVVYGSTPEVRWAVEGWYVSVTLIGRVAA